MALQTIKCQIATEFEKLGILSIPALPICLTPVERLQAKQHSTWPLNFARIQTHVPLEGPTSVSSAPCHSFYLLGNY